MSVLNRECAVPEFAGERTIAACRGISEGGTNELAAHRDCGHSLSDSRFHGARKRALHNLVVAAHLGCSVGAARATPSVRPRSIVAAIIVMPSAATVNMRASHFPAARLIPRARKRFAP